MTINISRNTLLAVALAIIVGFGAGYAVGKCGTHGRYGMEKQSMGMHRMPDGSMMSDGSSMKGMMDEMGAMLVGKTGDAFDRAFLEQMIPHHQGAIEMAKLASSSAQRQEIKDLSASIIAAQEKEIAEMEAWMKAWYGQ